MQDYFHEVEQEECLEFSIKELRLINQQITELAQRKEELTQIIIGALHHNHEGQKTYEYGEWKIAVKTPCTYTLNKKLYESGAINIPDNFNPIKESKSYTVDKRLVEEYMQYAPEEVRGALDAILEKRPGKKSVSVVGDAE